MVNLPMNSETETTDIDQLIAVEVVYAEPAVQHLIALQLPQGSSIWEAVEQSGLLEQCPALQARGDSLRDNVGIFGKVKPADSILKSGDRVEIYRPLLMDPKQARRLRAEKAALAGQQSNPQSGDSNVE